MTVSQASAKIGTVRAVRHRLTIHLDPDDAGLDALLPNLIPICRARKRLTVETINGEPARRSPYLPALSRHLRAVTDHRGVYFESMEHAR